MIPMKKWTKTYAHRRGYIGDMAQVFRKPGADARVSRFALSQAVLVRTKDPRVLLRQTIMRVAVNVLEAELWEDEPEGDAQYLLTLHRTTDVATSMVTTEAELVRVYDLDDVTPEASPAIDQTTTPFPEGDPR